MISAYSVPCSICGESSFAQEDILWPELIEEWGLSVEDVAYINRQQGMYCTSCNNSFRVIALAAAIMKECGYVGTLIDFSKERRQERILEINSAGNLTCILKNLPFHTLSEYPDIDMQNIDVKSRTYDLVIHSDTLEHVANPLKALSECRRVLKPGGKCIFTVPIVLGRLTRSREFLKPSYHGRPGCIKNNYHVFYEFGEDIWSLVLKAGFSSCEIFCLEFPAAFVVIGKTD